MESLNCRDDGTCVCVCVKEEDNPLPVARGAWNLYCLGLNFGNIAFSYIGLNHTLEKEEHKNVVPLFLQMFVSHMFI